MSRRWNYNRGVGYMNETESGYIKETDNMGREKFWEDLGRPENDGLALKIFKEQGCDNCSCKTQ
jgi:hypothetical protein